MSRRVSHKVYLNKFSQYNFQNHKGLTKDVTHMAWYMWH